MLPTTDVCQQARMSRDPRFDGLFYIAVKSTGIYCRPVCPAKTPAEPQVQYFASAASAAAAGFRPCLRCRPDSAPGSPAWQGVGSSLTRALRLIDEGALSQGNEAQLCERLGISGRYLRKLFAQHLGVSPKQYALYQQILFAKQLLHQTPHSVTDIALMAGFHSLRRFHDAFKQQLKLSPTQIRGQRMTEKTPVIRLELSYRPPLAWDLLISFWQQRTLNGLEWLDGDRYGRLIDWPPGQGQQHGWFEVSPLPQKPALSLQLYWPDSATLQPVVKQIRRLLDLDADMLTIEQQLQLWFGDTLKSGLRIPGVWSAWEAGVRAVLGQQVSVAGARTQLNRLLALGTEQAAPGPFEAQATRWQQFPTPAQLSADELLMLKVPQARRDTLKALAQLVSEAPQATPEQWLPIKGIGPWTVAYASMRGLSAPDIWLGGDLGVQKALARRALQQAAPLSTQQATQQTTQQTTTKTAAKPADSCSDNSSSDNISDAAASLPTPDNSGSALAPWRSYATLQLWFSLGH